MTKSQSPSIHWSLLTLKRQSVRYRLFFKMRWGSARRITISRETRVIIHKHCNVLVSKILNYHDEMLTYSRTSLMQHYHGNTPSGLNVFVTWCKHAGFPFKNNIHEPRYIIPVKIASTDTIQ